MKVRDRAETPWLVRSTEIFEAAFWRRLATHEVEAGLEVIDLFERQAVIDPRMPGEQHPELLALWVFETPSAVRRLPHLVVVYTIDDNAGMIDLWNLYRL